VVMLMRISTFRGNVFSSSSTVEMSEKDISTFEYEEKSASNR
jgi:hypothetical protein